jgi:hypothetical protein
VNHSGEFYVVLEAQRSSWRKEVVEKVKGVRLTQAKPTHLQVDQIAVKIRVSVPDEAWEPYEVPQIEVVYERPTLTAVQEV